MSDKRTSIQDNITFLFFPKALRLVILVLQGNYYLINHLIKSQSSNKEVILLHEVLIHLFAEAISL
uniref:Putative ovule protein n=1 Tax=Solanum chacoense TaxID=4108 RepID=A0A0V0GTL9_SOLCH